MKTIKNKNVLDTFNIGFEFEFYVSTKVLGEMEPIEQVPEEVLKQYGHLFTVKQPSKKYFNTEDAGEYFLKKLKETYPEENWKKIFEIHEDGSLDNTESQIGVEMVMKYDLGSKAIEKLLKVFSVLNCSEFITNNDCGLHVNMSYKDNKKNKKDMVFNINDCLEKSKKDKILKDFGRTNNGYCTVNDKTEISSYYFKDNLSEGLQRFIVSEANSITKNGYTYANLAKLSTNLINSNNLQKFKEIISDTIRAQFLNDWEYDRPAIAPKKMSNKHYIEFRMIGGKDYQKKYPDVENAINEYLKAMVKADVIYTKELAQKQIAKAKMK